MKVIFRYPTVTMYGQGIQYPQIYKVTSVMVEANSGLHHYREIIRVSDQAKQIIEASIIRKTCLFYDKQLSCQTHISISHKWTYSSRSA